MDGTPAVRLGPMVAHPGDPDLDCHLTGLTITDIVTSTDGPLTEAIVTFGTSEAAGFWNDSRTGERVIPSEVTSVETVFGLRMRPGTRWILDTIMMRLYAWRHDGALVTMTSAPGKWTLLYCPQHPAGEIIPVPRGDNLEAAMPETAEQLAMGAATRAVRRILASAKNRRTLLGRARPTTVAYHAAWEAVSVYRETLAHEQARRLGGICAQCGRRPEAAVALLDPPEDQP